MSLTLPAFLSTPGWRIFCCRSSGPGRRFLDLKTGNTLELLYDKNTKTVERTDLPRAVILLLAKSDNLEFLWSITYIGCLRVYRWWKQFVHLCSLDGPQDDAVLYSLHHFFHCFCLHVGCRCCILKSNEVDEIFNSLKPLWLRAYCRGVYGLNEFWTESNLTNTLNCSAHLPEYSLGIIHFWKTWIHSNLLRSYIIQWI